MNRDPVDAKASAPRPAPCVPQGRRREHQHPAGCVQETDFATKSSALTIEMTLECSLPVGIKDYSNWPTIPQVYLNGEFVGGCDILLQMHQNGDLVEELRKLGIRSALVDEKKDQDSK